jgi:hypothetical protein
MKNELITLNDNATALSFDEQRIMQYVSRYRAFARNTAESIIGLGRTVAEASETLTGAELDIFCTEVGIEPQGSTYRKLRKIGAQADRLSAHMNNLPNSWTTVYALAHMDKDAFDQIVESNLLTPTVSMKEITQVLKGDKIAKDKLSISLTAEATTPEQAFQLEQACNAIIAKHGGVFRWSNSEKRGAWMNELLELRMAA